MTQQSHFASMATWLSSTGISHTVSSLTFPRFVSPQSTAVLALKLLHSPCAPAPSHCTLQGNCIPVQGTYGCGKDCLIFIPFRLPQISCFTVSLKCFSSDSDNCPNVGIGHLLQFFHSPRVGPVLLLLPPTPVPSSYQVFCGSIYSFPLVRSSCPLSACVLHALLCLKV